MKGGQIAMSTEKQKEYELFLDYIENHSDKFYRLAFSYMKNEHDALDVVQDAVYKGIKSYDQLKNKEHYKTWLYRIVVNTALTHLKKNKRVVLVDYLHDEEDKSIDLDRYIDLHEAIGNLKEEHRMIIQLRYFADLKIEDISKIMKMNINTVKTKLYSALSVLRNYVGDEV